MNKTQFTLISSKISNLLPIHYGVFRGATLSLSFLLLPFIYHNLSRADDIVTGIEYDDSYQTLV